MDKEQVEEVKFVATANGGTSPAFTWNINGKPTGAMALLSLPAPFMMEIG